MSNEFTKKFMENIGSAAEVFYNYSEEDQNILINLEIQKLFPSPGKAEITKQDIADIAVLRVLKNIIGAKDEHKRDSSEAGKYLQ